MPEHEEFRAGAGVILGMSGGLIYSVKRDLEYPETPFWWSLGSFLCSDRRRWTRGAPVVSIGGLRGVLVWGGGSGRRGGGTAVGKEEAAGGASEEGK